MNKTLKLSFLALISMFSLSSFSQSTVKVAENIEANFYVRTNNINRSGNTVDFWQVVDYKQAKINNKGEQYLSIEQHLIIDCLSNTQTLVYVKVFSSSMLSGSMLANGSLKQKNPIPSGTSLEVVRNFVCK